MSSSLHDVNLEILIKKIFIGTIIIMISTTYMVCTTYSTPYSMICFRFSARGSSATFVTSLRRMTLRSIISRWKGRTRILDGSPILCEQHRAPKPTSPKRTIFPELPKLYAASLIKDAEYSQASFYAKILFSGSTPALRAFTSTLITPRAAASIETCPESQGRPAARHQRAWIHVRSGDRAKHGRWSWWNVVRSRLGP